MVLATRSSSSRSWGRFSGSMIKTRGARVKVAVKESHLQRVQEEEGLETSDLNEANRQRVQLTAHRAYFI